MNSIRLAVFALLACVAAGASAQGGVLRFGYSTGTTSFDPARSSTGGDRVYLFPVYDRLIRLTNTGEPRPMLATKWEFRNNGKTLHLTLQRRARFHDGASVDAAAVKANLDRLMTMPESTQKAVLGAISSVRVIDDATVEIDCKIGCGGLLQALGDTAGMMVSPKAFGNPDLGRAPVGAGPYVLTEYRTGSRAVYAPAKGYYDRSNQTLGGLEVYVFPDDATRLNALRSGQLDMTFLRPYQVEEAKAAGLNVGRNKSAIWYYMGLNMNRSKFGDLRVRQALNHAVDKKKVTESLLRGYCTPSDQPFPQGVLGFARQTPQIAYPYDLQKAKRLLAEAGVPDGFEFDAMVVIPPFFVQIAEALQAELAKVGVKMNVQPAPIPQVNSTYFAKGGADAYVGLNLGQSDPSATVANLYLKTGFFNPSRFTTPEIEAAYRRTVEQPEDAARQAAFEEVMKNAVANAYHVGLCNVLTPVAYSKAVRNAGENTPTWQWDFYGIEIVRQ